MTTRSSYWTCSKFAHWVQTVCGVDRPKPTAATSEEWRDWKRHMKEHYPKVYWFTEEFLDDLQDILMFIPDCYNELRYYVSNRYFDKIHYLPTRLKPGRYHEISDRMLHGLFETLVDYIEVEKASMQMWGEKEKDYRYPLVFRLRVLRWFGHYRCPQAGLDYLKWEMALGDNSPYQAKSAMKQWELYRWWKYVRPNRPDSYEKSGLSKILDDSNDSEDDELPIFNFSRNDPEYEAASILQREIEDAYEAEDTQMMKDLIEIRRELWT